MRNTLARIAALAVVALVAVFIGASIAPAATPPPSREAEKTPVVLSCVWRVFVVLSVVDKKTLEVVQDLEVAPLGGFLAAPVPCGPKEVQ